MFAFVSIQQSFWRNMTSAELYMHVHIFFGLMIYMALKMEKGVLQ